MEPKDNYSEADIENIEELQKILKKEDKESKTRHLTGFPRTLAFIIGVLTTCFVIFTALTGIMLPMIQRGIVMCSLLALTFLWYPATARSPKNRPSVLDWCFVLSCGYCLGWTLFNLSRFLTRIPFASKIELGDYVAAILLIMMILEAGRRTLGISITLIGAFFIFYAFAGPYFPGAMAYKGLSVSKFVDQIYLTTEGVWGSLSGMAATMLFGFIGFGAMLKATGADQHFMNICIALTGKKPGGPAKVSVLSSAAMGTISGSSIANVVTTGTLTIPLMKSTGYTSEEAGAIEAASSTGGQIMPPVMGTAAFILAETVGVPYMDVVTVSIIPALLYYLVIYFSVDTKARKRGLQGMAPEDIPHLKQALKGGGIFFIPIALLILLLAFNFTPFLAGIGCMFMILLFAELRKSTRIGPKDVLCALESCARSMCSVAGVIYCASIIISMINITGLMMKTTAIILSISSGKLWLTILLIAIIAYVMGMGLPIATSYIILSTLAGPAMIKLGVPALCAHLSIFWFTQLSGLTPPVCMTAFAAATIAKAEPMKTGFEALKYGFTFYYLPVLFIYSDLIIGSWPQRIGIFVLTLVAAYFLGSTLEGYFMGQLRGITRLLGVLVFVLLYGAMFRGTNLMVSTILIVISALLVMTLVVTQKTGKKGTIT